MEVEKELIALRADEKIKKLKQPKKEKEDNKMETKNFTEKYMEMQETISHPIWDSIYVESQEEQEKREIKMTEQVEIIEEVTIEMLDEEFEDPKLSESQEIEIEKMVKEIKELRVEEVLRENDARFFMLGSNFEEVAKDTYLAGLEFKLEDAILLLLGSDDEVYYMVVSDLSKLSSDIKYFKNKLLDREGTLDPEFDKVELDFLSEKLDFRYSSYDDVCLIEITR